MAKGVPDAVVSVYDLHHLALFDTAVCSQSIAAVAVTHILSEPLMVVSRLCSFISSIP